MRQDEIKEGRASSLTYPGSTVYKLAVQLPVRYFKATTEVDLEGIEGRGQDG